MTQLAEKLPPWVAAGRPAGGPRWLHDVRERAAATFTGLGFPSVRDEEWRFTNVAPITAGDFQPAGAGALGSSDVDDLPYSAATGHRIVVVNGRYAPELSRVGGLPRGVAAGSLSAAINGDLQADREIVQRYVGQLADFTARPFVALNTAFLDDGAYLHVQDGVILEEPIQVLFVSASPADRPTVSYPRCLIVLGEQSQARVIETYVGANGAGYLTNAVTEVFAGENAILDHYKVQQESEHAFHLGSMHVHAARSANFSSHSFSLGGKLVRNDVLATLDGEGAEVTLNGLYLADGDRLVDNHTTIDHAQPHCPSHEIYKGILGGRAKAVFNGKIIVRKDAQKTDAKQTNRALLLSDDALINTKPQLEIFADDVKCTHGAAIGQLDEDALFYLRARGLTHFEARDMLIHAFAGEVIERVKVAALKQELESQLYAQLARDLAEVDAA